MWRTVTYPRLENSTSVFTSHWVRHIVLEVSSMEWCQATRYPKVCMEKKLAERLARERRLYAYECGACKLWHLTKVKR